MLSQTQGGEGAGEVIDGTIELITNGETGERGWKMVKGLVELGALKSEDAERGGEMVHRLFEAVRVDDEGLERGRKMVDRSIEETAVAIEAQEREVGRKMVHI